MPILCRRCGSENLRPSQLRFQDLKFFLVFRYPARCRNCRGRFYLSFLKILRVHRYAKARPASGSRGRLRQTFNQDQ